MKREKREKLRKGGREKNRDDGEEKAKRQRNRAAVRIRAMESCPPILPIHLPHRPGLTAPVWGCPRCRTSHTHGSADTRGRSGSGHSSGTWALSARCRAAGVEVSEPGHLRLSNLRPISPATHPDRTCHPSLGSPHMGTGPSRQQTENRCGWTGTRHTGSSWPGSRHRSGAWG